jgi:hypothetical protein
LLGGKQRTDRRFGRPYSHPSGHEGLQLMKKGERG